MEYAIKKRIKIGMIRITKKENDSIYGKITITSFAIGKHYLTEREHWKMSKTQKAFFKLVKRSADGITLREAQKELSILPSPFPTGALMILVGKGYLKTDGPSRAFTKDIIKNGEITGHITYGEVVFRLAK